MVESSLSQIEATFVVPSTDLILLTDARWSAGVFATPATQAGLMLSRGAIRLLYHAWFSEEVLQIGSAVAELNLSSDIAPRFNTDVSLWLEEHPGLTISDTPPDFTSVTQEEVTVSAQRSLSLTGFKSVTVAPGRVLARHIAGFLVQYHERAEPLPEGLVPILNTPQSVGLGLEQGTLTQFMPRPTSVPTASLCSVCGSCGICGGCALCGEVNYFVATASFSAAVATINFGFQIQS